MILLIKNLKRVAVLLVVFYNFIFVKVVIAQSTYVPLVPDGPLAAGTGGDLSAYLKTVFNWGVGVAVALAILFIIFGGVEYMTTDAIFKKEDGRKKITAAVSGLLIVLSSWLILNTINPNIFKNNITLQGITGAQLPAYVPQAYYNATPYDRSVLNSIPGGPGNTLITSYGYVGDFTPDTNSSQARGNRNNLLVSGSVALSPDVISRTGAKPGAAVYVGGKLVGYYDDSTAKSYNGKPLTNRVDIYDPLKSLGGNNFSQTSPGAITVDNSNIRPQAPNPK